MCMNWRTLYIIYLHFNWQKNFLENFVSIFITSNVILFVYLQRERVLIGGYFSVSKTNTTPPPPNASRSVKIYCHADQDTHPHTHPKEHDVICE